MENKSKVIISLTTIPSRLPKIKPCLQSLIKQGYPVHLWIPRYFKRGKEKLPSNLPSFLNQINVNYHIVEDFGSITKLLPALKLDVDYIITADDDAIYGNEWASDLVSYAKQYPNTAICYRGRSVKNGQKYNNTKLIYNVNQPTKINLITGVWGAIYSPTFFKETIWDEYLKWTLGDDLIISQHLQNNKIKMLTIPLRNRINTSYDNVKNIDALWALNKKDKNDTGINILKDKSVSSPIISLTIPVSEAGLPCLYITLDSLKYQTAQFKDFEVIVAIDTNNNITSIKKKIIEMELPYTHTIVKSPRNNSPELGHRNHARNKACSLAKGKILWPVDSDHLMEGHTIQSIIDAHRKADSLEIYLFPRFWLNIIPKNWIKQYWANKKNYKDFFKNISMTSSSHPGYGSKYFKINGGISDIKEKYIENQPAFPRILFDALGGFDERYLAWGGNKHEFVVRLFGLQDMGLVKFKIIQSTRLIHQPHYKDHSRHQSLGKKNREKVEKCIVDVKNRARWWKAQSNIAKEVITSHKAGGAVIIPNMCSEIYKNLGDVDVIAINSTLRKPRENLTLLQAAPHLTEMDQLALAAPHAESGRLVIVRPGKKPSAEKILNAFSTDEDIICISKHQLGELGNYPSYITTFDDLAQVLNDGTQFLNTTPYRQRLPEISTYRPLILKKKPKVSLGIITFNRKGVLKQALDSLRKSMRPDLFEYDVFIVDDGSTDGTVAFLKTQEFPWKSFERGGVHRQSNRILKHFNGNVEYGFLCNDDLTYKEGWEEAYIAAMKHTPYEHIVYMDHGYESKVSSTSLKNPQDVKVFDGVPLVCWRSNRIQGVLLTFTQKSIDKVGGMDAGNLGLCSHGHVDYTLRNIKAGMAPGKKTPSTGVYDIMGSNNVLKLILAPHAAPGRPGAQKSQAYFNKVKNKAGRIKVGMAT